MAAEPIPFMPKAMGTGLAAPDIGALNGGIAQRPMSVADVQSSLEITVGDDGSVDVKARDGSDEPTPRKDTKFDDNLCDVLEPGQLDILAEELLKGIEADDRSRTEMIDAYTRGMDMLGLKLEGDAGGYAGQSGGKNVSRTRHPILLWACVKFQAGARNELLPADGPVKAKVDGDDTAETNDIAQAFEQDFNHYLTVTASEFYPDTDRGLFYLAYGGTLFKKVYQCPLRERPISECVYLPDLIVSNDATDLENAQRVTHRFAMPQDTMRQLQDDGFYRDVPLVQPSEPQVDPAKQKESQIAGVSPSREQPEDKLHTLYECYTQCDLWRFGINEKGAKKGRALPYRVTIDKESRKVVEVRRNWKEKDETFTRRKRFVKYGLVPGFGFYDYGFLHLLGNHTKALTALWRIAIDSGMFAVFPGGLRLKGARASTNEFHPAPGQFPEIDVPAGVDDIRKLIMAMPYKEPSAVLLEMMQQLEKQAQAMAGTIEIESGEGRTNMPVGTILSMIEQQTQVMSAVHKRNHASQQEELLLLKELIAEDPTCLCRYQKDPARQWQEAQEFADVNIVPASDPNIPAQVHRIMQSNVLVMLAQQMPELFQLQEIAKRVLRTIGIGDADSLLNPNPAPPGPRPDPKAQAAQAELPLKAAKLQLDGQKLQQQSVDTQRQAAADAVEAQNRQQEQQVDLQLEAARLQATQATAAATIEHAHTQLAHDTAHKNADREQAERHHQQGLVPPHPGGVQ